jgi:DNA-binding winged helix-turn-helix (wHTH) protein
MIFSFGEYRIDLERRELWHAETPVHVEPQVFDLLVCLVQNRDRVVSKDDLIASVWGDRIISESTLTSRINAARKAIGDSGGDQKLIRTVPRKGLRFVGAVGTQASGAAQSRLPDSRRMGRTSPRTRPCRSGPPLRCFLSPT